MVFDSEHSLSSSSMTLLQRENKILKQKVLYLTGLCEHHKSEYEQLKAKNEVERNNARETYTLRIDELSQRIRNQKQQLDITQRHCKDVLQFTEHTAIEHRHEIESMQQTKRKEIQKVHVLLEQNEALKAEEINRLENELMHKSDEIAHLKHALTERCGPFDRSSSSLTFEISGNTIPRPKSTSSQLSTLSQLSVKYANRNRDMSPVPSLSSDSYDHSHWSQTSNTEYSSQRQSNNPTQTANRTVRSALSSAAVDYLEEWRVLYNTIEYS
eukprot:1009805_1